MSKQITNWHLSILVVVASIFSLILVQQQVLAQWQDPTSPPGSSGSTKLVVTPMVADLDLNGKSITDTDFSLDPGGTIGIEISGNAWAGYFTGDVKVTGDLDVATINGGPPGSLWSENGTKIYYNSGNVGIGTNNPSSLLHLADVSGELQFSSTGLSETDETPLLLSSANDIYLQPNGSTAVALKESGYVGIGIDTPNKQLHVYEGSGNAEIDIQSGAGVTSYWGIYQDSFTSDLRFWNQSNKVVFTDEGNVGIGTNNPTYVLQVDATTYDRSAIYAKTDTAGTMAIYAENTGSNSPSILASGYYGMMAAANQAGGAGILAAQGTGAYSGVFYGELRLYNSTGYAYLHLATISSNPPAEDCDSTDERGRMIYNYVDNTLFICDWDPAEPSGGGWKYDVQETVPL